MRRRLYWPLAALLILLASGSHGLAVLILAIALWQSRPRPAAKSEGRHAYSADDPAFIANAIHGST